MEVEVNDMLYLSGLCFEAPVQFEESQEIFRCVMKQRLENESCFLGHMSASNQKLRKKRKVLHRTLLPNNSHSVLEFLGIR